MEGISLLAVPRSVTSVAVGLERGISTSGSWTSAYSGVNDERRGIRRLC